MALTNAFYEAVRTSNIRSIRIMMKDSLLVDPSFAEFSEMEKAAAAVEGLYDVHDNRPFDEDPNHWNDAYMNRIMVQLVTNFSHERINHAKAVVLQRQAQQSHLHRPNGQHQTTKEPKSRHKPIS